jgi:nitrogenase-associated protein
MTETVVFYEKPGCLSNARQQEMLRVRGHRLEVRDLLSEPWTLARLRSFFGDRPVAEWFNPSAPGIKSGEERPAELGETQALARMSSEPLLIRRPLIEIRGGNGGAPGAEVEIRRGCGFESGPFLQSLGISLTPVQNVQSCSRAGPEPSCPIPGA